ncbi:DUF2931 family protein [Maribacter luteus]|uniref:DUF2931 family protein n=1 Tax=Maribacter luteus TaxID=2594478 RepID=UPI0024931C05|nr:DUF2931 family protein [Maribacter luteus]
MKKFEWRPTANAPKYYPAEVIAGNFYMQDGSSIYIPTGHTLMTGWGNTGAAHIVGEDFKPVPYKFDIKWVSYLEEKFYGGTFELPKEKMEALFEKGFINSRNQQETYDSIVLGLAPGGVLVVWMYGSFTVEIARYQAEEVEVTEEEFIPYANMSKEQYVKETKKDIIDEDIKGAIDVDNIPFGIWDTYRKKYNWAPKVLFKKEGETLLKTIVVNYYNGEFFNTYGQNPVVTEMKERPIPYRSAMSWRDDQNNNYGAKVFFDEKEIFGLFDTIYNQKKAPKANLIFEIDKFNSSLKVYFKTENEIYPIKKAEVKVYLASS